MLKWHHVGLISLRSWFESRSRYQKGFADAYLEFDHTSHNGFGMSLLLIPIFGIVIGVLRENLF